ncbi:MAG: DegV family protein [Clostridia bacterium]|nr:DegV family protein [Clostridia bacterium]
MLENIQLTSDSSCDLNDDQLKENGIVICPIAVILDGKELYDTVNIDAESVLDFVNKTGKLPKTAATPKDKYVEFFKKFRDEGKTVIHFCISSKASSCHEHAVAAAEEVGGVYVIDSYALSGGQGLEILKAADMIRENKFDNIDDLVNEIEANTNKTQLSFVVDTLEFLHKGGRCSSVALIGSKILKIHPSIYNKDGALTVQKKYMGNMQRCLGLYVQDLSNDFKDYDETRCFITHSPADKELVDFVREKVMENFKFNEIIETFAGSTVTSHCGRNTIGVLFMLK